MAYILEFPGGRIRHVVCTLCRRRFCRSGTKNFANSTVSRHGFSPRIFVCFVKMKKIVLQGRKELSVIKMASKHSIRLRCLSLTNIKTRQSSLSCLLRFVHVLLVFHVLTSAFPNISFGFYLRLCFHSIRVRGPFQLLRRRSEKARTGNRGRHGLRLGCRRYLRGILCRGLVILQECEYGSIM